MSLERMVGGVQWVVGVATLAFIVMLFSLGPKEGGFDLTESPYAMDGSGEAPDVALVIDQGAHIYSSKCARCHGANGGGGTGPRLEGMMVDAYPDPAAEAAVVASGRNGMPGFSSSLSPEEIEAVVAFTRDGL